jgi:ketosteroid isomerase-like protein
VIERYFAAMQRGPDGHDALVELFTDDAVYVEPFSGGPAHRGREAIRAYLAASAGETPPELKIVVERLDVEMSRIVATWRCESSIFAVPSRGRDVFDVVGGRIARLETTLLSPPVLRRAES